MDQETIFELSERMIDYAGYLPSSNKSTIRIGDLVKLKTGYAHQRVLEKQTITSSGEVRIKCKYLNSDKDLGFRPVSDYELVEHAKYENKKDDNTMMKGKLYQTLDASAYGEGLVIDGDGKYVLKMNNGEYKAFAATELKRVMPYTFDVVFMGSGAKRYSYFGNAGTVAEGDLLLNIETSSLVRVVAVGTESDTATRKFEGVKLVTEAIA